MCWIAPWSWNNSFVERRIALNQLMGAVHQGLIYAVLAVGVYVAFRILNTPDLTTDGFPCGRKSRHWRCWRLDERIFLINSVAHKKKISSRARVGGETEAMKFSGTAGLKSPIVQSGT
jgi:hypothetical protein